MWESGIATNTYNLWEAEAGVLMIDQDYTVSSRSVWMTSVRPCMKTRVGESVKCLPCKCVDPASVQRTHVKKLVIVAHICNPSAGEVETGRSWDSQASQPSQTGEFQANMIACPAKYKLNDWHPAFTHRHVCIQTCKCPVCLHMHIDMYIHAYIQPKQRKFEGECLTPHEQPVNFFSLLLAPKLVIMLISKRREPALSLSSPV